MHTHVYTSCVDRRPGVWVHVTPGASGCACTWPQFVSPETDLEWRVWEQAVYLGGDQRRTVLEAGAVGAGGCRGRETGCCSSSHSCVARGGAHVETRARETKLTHRSVSVYTPLLLWEHQQRGLGCVLTRAHLCPHHSRAGHPGVSLHVSVLACMYLCV